MSGWAVALRFAVRGLGLSPEAFWRLSVREWRMLTGTEAPLRRAELAALMAAFPDRDGQGGAAGDGDGMSRGGRVARDVNTT